MSQNKLRQLSVYGTTALMIGLLSLKVAFSQCSACPCPIAPITSLSNDSDTQALENGALVMTGVNQTLLNGFGCAFDAIYNTHGQFLAITAARRTVEYQKHLREIWDKKQVRWSSISGHDPLAPFG